MVDPETFAMLDKLALDLASLSDPKETRPCQPDGAAVSEAAVKEPSVGEMWQMRHWLQQQHLEYQGALYAAKNKDPPSSNDPEQLQARVTGLQQQLMEAATDTSLRDLILQRLQMSHRLLETVFPPGGIKNITPEQQQTRKTVVELLEKQVNLSCHVLRISKEIEEMTPELEETKKKNFELLKSNRELMWNLEQSKKAAESSNSRGNQRLQQAQQEVDEVMCRVELVRPIFQGLILGSGIDWAADKEMADLMVGLGMPLESHLH